MRPDPRPLLRCLAVACLFLTGCSQLKTARHRVDTDLVRSIRFDIPDRGGLPVLRTLGIYAYSGQTNYQLRSSMEQGVSSFGATLFPLSLIASPEELDTSALDHDAWRLEVWYAHHGWFDAEFRGWDVTRVRPRTRRRSGVVDIRGHIVPGAPSLVRGFEIRGMDEPTVSPLQGAVRSRSLVRVDEAFDLTAVQATRQQLLAVLAEHGFPYATADVEIDAYPEEHAVDVAIGVDPGRLAVFGDVTVVGTTKVPEHYVREALTFSSGEKFRESELARTQQELFKFRTFSLVELVPDLSDPSVRDVPVTVSVTETSFRSLRGGGGVEYENATFTPRVTGSFEHTNLFHRLVKLEVDGAVGLAFSARRQEPTWSAAAKLSSARLARGRMGVSTSASVTRDFQQGQFAFFNPKARVDVLYKPNREISFGGGTSLELYRFVDFTGGALVAARALFGSDFQNPYRLITLNGTAVFDWRDDPVFTTRGSFYSVGVRQAVPILGSTFLYTELSGDLRRYLRPRSRQWTLAFRLSGRAIQPWSGSGVPYPERAFLGGSTSLRGFQANQVGPYDVLCVYEPTAAGDPFTGVPGAGLEVSRNSLPKGGLFALTTQVEFRASFQSFPEMSVVPFVDVGVLSPSLLETRPRHLRAGGGVGFRYASLVGPIRLDFALRPTYPEDEGPVGAVDCLESDVQPRNFDIISALWAKQRDATTRPLALNIYLTIGEAF